MLRGETGSRAMTRADERNTVLRYLRLHPRSTTAEIARHVARHFIPARTPMRVRVMKRLNELDDLGLATRDNEPREHLWTAVPDEWTHGRCD